MAAATPYKLGFTSKDDPLYPVSGARALDMIESDPQWLKGGVIFVEAHCLAVPAGQWVHAVAAPLPDSDLCLIELAPSLAGEEDGFSIHFHYTFDFFKSAMSPRRQK